MQNSDNAMVAVYHKLEVDCLQCLQGILSRLPAGANATEWCRQGGSRDRFYATYGEVVLPPLQALGSETAKWLRDTTTEPSVRKTLTDQLQQYVLMTALNPVFANWNGFLQARQNLAQTREALDEADLQRRAEQVRGVQNAYGAGGAGSLPSIAINPTFGSLMGSLAQGAFLLQSNTIAQENYKRMVEKYRAFNQQSEALEVQAGYELIEALGHAPLSFIDCVGAACLGADCSRQAAEAAAARVVAALQSRLAQLKQFFGDIPRALQQLAAEAEAARLAREQAAREAVRRRALKRARTWGLGVLLVASLLSVLRLNPGYSRSQDGFLCVIAALIAGGYVLNNGISIKFRPHGLLLVGARLTHLGRGSTGNKRWGLRMTGHSCGQRRISVNGFILFSIGSGRSGPGYGSPGP